MQLGGCVCSGPLLITCAWYHAILSSIYKLCNFIEIIIYPLLPLARKTIKIVLNRWCLALDVLLYGNHVSSI
jgi:hypothetical protein